MKREYISPKTIVEYVNFEHAILAASGENEIKNGSASPTSSLSKGSGSIWDDEDDED